MTGARTPTTTGARRARPLRIVLAICSLLALGGGAALYQRALAPVAEHAQPVYFTVAPGAGFAQVADALAARGLIRNATALQLHARLSGRADEVRAGEYELSARMGARAILHKLTSGRVRTHTVVIAEGLRLEQIAGRLAQVGLVERDAFVTAARDPERARALGVEGETLEGYLFPETYQLARGLAAGQVAATLVEQFLSVWRELEPAATSRGLSMREVVTLASIIEKETAVAAERPLIAAVFQNRLAQGMRLEADPTVIYGIKSFDGNLRRIHLEDASNPYNTYKIPALPPGPIASPGEASLRAAIEPADAPFLFFVARGDGTHKFSRTYAEHRSAVDRFQRRRR